MLAIEGAIVTIDAMGCQRDIAQKVLDKKANYVLALKGNQGSLREDVELFVAEQKARGFENTTISRDQTTDGDHGRIETRTTTVIHDIAWLQERHDWPGLKGVVIVESRRETGGKIEQETRFYITSLVLFGAPIGSEREFFFFSFLFFFFLFFSFFLFFFIFFYFLLFSFILFYFILI